MPGPLDNRCFGTMVTRAFTRAGAFVVAQIPIDLKNVPNAIYSNGENKTSGSNAKRQEKVTMGKYVSVERVHEQDDGNVNWEMAVASDAGGFLPMALQKMGLPGAISKDVGLFMKQAAEKRSMQPTGHGKAEELAKPEEVNGVKEQSNGTVEHSNGTAAGPGPTENL